MRRVAFLGGGGVRPDHTQPGGRHRCSRRALLVATAALALGLAFALPSSAGAVACPGCPVGGKHPQPPPTTPPATSPTSPAAPANGGFPDNGGILGGPGILDQPDATCKQLIAGTSPLVIRNCASDQQPRSAYPAGNYGLDVHVDTGVLSPGDDIAAIFQNIISAIFQAMVSVIGAVLSILGWAFNFDLFRSGFGTINTAVGREVSGFTIPLLPLAFLILGGSLMVRWVRHNESAMASHAVVAVALAALGFIIAWDSAGVLGPIDNFTNQLSGATIGLISGNGRSNGYADSEPALWNTAVEQPWCEEEFGSLTWCTSPVDPAMRAAAANIVNNHADKALGDQGTPQQAKAEAPLERVRVNDAKTNGQEFLSFWTNSDARNGKNDSWTLYNVVNKEHPALLTIRGPGGWVQRAVGLIAGAFVGLTFLALIAYITLQIVVNSFIIVACLLATPLAILVPVSPAGQDGFFKFIGWFFFAFLRKVVYAGYLGIIILMTGVIATIAQPAGFVVYWFLLAVLYAAALVFRKKPMELLGLHAHPTGEHHIIAKGAAVAAAGYGVARWRRRGTEADPVVTRTADETHYHNEERHETHQHLHVYNGNGHGDYDDEQVVPVGASGYSSGDDEAIEGQTRELPEAGDGYEEVEE